MVGRRHTHHVGREVYTPVYIPLLYTQVGTPPVPPCTTLYTHYPYPRPVPLRCVKCALLAGRLRRVGTSSRGARKVSFSHF